MLNVKSTKSVKLNLNYPFVVQECMEPSPYIRVCGGPILGDIKLAVCADSSHCLLSNSNSHVTERSVSVIHTLE